MYFTRSRYGLGHNLPQALELARCLRGQIDRMTSAQRATVQAWSGF
jgi:hypothetical protein